MNSFPLVISYAKMKQMSSYSKNTSHFKYAIFESENKFDYDILFHVSFKHIPFFQHFLLSVQFFFSTVGF